MTSLRRYRVDSTIGDIVQLVRTLPRCRTLSRAMPSFLLKTEAKSRFQLRMVFLHPYFEVRPELFCKRPHLREFERACRKHPRSRCHSTVARSSRVNDVLPNSPTRSIIQPRHLAADDSRSRFIQICGKSCKRMDSAVDGRTRSLTAICSTVTENGYAAHGIQGTHVRRL